MADKQTKTTKGQAGTELAPADKINQLETQFDDDVFFDMDDGMADVTADDLSLARYTILQGLSPQVNPRKDEYVEGAQIGMIMNTATGRVYDSIPLVMAAYERRNIEWIPRDKPCPIEGLPKVTGGGLYKDYGTDDSILEECVRFEGNGSLWTPRGHQLVVTGTWYVIDPETLSTAFIAMGNTQFTPSKKLMAGIRDEKVRSPNGIRPAPLFYRIWELGTKIKSDGENEWFVWNHKPNFRIQEHENGRDILEAVREMVRTIKEGEAVIDITVGETDQASSPKGDDARM